VLSGGNALAVQRASRQNTHTRFDTRMKTLTHILHRQAVAGPVMVALLLLLSSCASLQKPADPPLRPVLASKQLDGSVRMDTENAEIATLWSAAEQARANQNDQKALDILLRALEISPKNSLLWSRAAEIQLDNNQPIMAENYATRSNLFAEKNNAMQLRNWLIIEHSRNLRGDLLGVRSAHKKVQQYQYQ
jgi:hypothetical protein